MKINITADGNSAAFDLQGAFTVQASGTFGGATVALQVSLDGGTTYTAVDDGSFTAAKVINLDVGKCKARLATSSASGTTAVAVQFVSFRDVG
jgi:L-fucose isomerase-like protein